MLRLRLSNGLAAFSLAFLVSAFPTTHLYSQTVGKVIGKVTDRATGQPIVGAQVVVEGTLLGNVTDDRGEYFILNVPVGLQSFTASSVGYRSVTVRDQRMLAGQTATIDFALEPTVVEIAGLVVEGEREPLVPRDNTVSKARITGETQRGLPTDNVVQAVTLQAGVTRFGSGREAGFSDISIRGGRPTEHAVFIDGLNVRNFLTQGVDVNISEVAVEETDVITGGFSAEFGNAQSGVINIVTRGGGTRYSGQLRLETEEGINTASTNYGFNRAQVSFGGPFPGYTPLTFFLSGEATGQGTSGPFAGGFLGTTEDLFEVASRWQNIPFAGRTLNAQDFLRRASAFDAQSGRKFPLLNLDREFPGRLPGGQTDQLILQGKLVWQPVKYSKLVLSYVFNRDQSLAGNTFDRLGTINPALQAAEAAYLEANPLGPQGGSAGDPRGGPGAGTRDKSQIITLNYNQTIAQTAVRNLNLDVRGSYKTRRLISGQLFDPENFTLDPVLRVPVYQSLGFEERDNFLGTNFFFEDIPIFLDDIGIALVEGDADACQQLFAAFMASIGESCSDFDDGILNRIKPSQSGFPLFAQVPNVPLINNNPFGIGVRAAWREPGDLGTTFDLIQEDTYDFAAKLDAQLTKEYRLTVGGQATFFDFDNMNILINRQLFFDIFHVEPREYAAYVQNRLDFGDLVIDAGGRVDIFDPRSDVVETPAGTGFPRRPDAVNNPNVPRFSADTKTEFGPRLGVAHPITENVQMRLSYGKFFQLPAFNQLFSAINTDLAETNTNDVFGNPNLDFQEMTSFEVGITALLGPDLVLDAVGYHRAIEGGVSARINIMPEEVVNGQFFRQQGDIRVLQNADFGTAKGFDLTLRKRFANYFSGDITYSFMNSRSTGTDPFNFVRNEGFTLGGVLVAPPVDESPNDFDVTHTFNVATSVNLPDDFAEGTAWNTVFKNAGLFFTLQANSGRPFTRQDPLTFEFLEPSNLSRRGWDLFGDIRVNKDFKVGTLQYSFFVDVRNLFDNQNLSNRATNRFSDIAFTNGVFQSTGDPLNDGRILEDARLGVRGGPIDLSVPDFNGDSVVDAQDTLLRDISARRDFDGDGFVDREEQMVSRVLALASGRGSFANFGPPRQVRVGFEFRF